MTVEDLVGALDRRDMAAFGEALQALGSAVPGQTPDEVADIAADLLVLLERLPTGIGSYLAPVVGSLCDFGAEPAAVLPTLVDCAIRVLRDAARFKELAAAAGIDRPEPGDESAFPAVMRALLAEPRPGLSEAEIADAAEAWFAGRGWVQPVLHLAQRKDVRTAMPRRAELTAAVENAREEPGIAQWLHGLLLVLDDEPLVVLHRATSQGWKCAISGIGDNFQLHTLLAGRLAALIPIPSPTPVELAAAQDGEPQPPEGIRGNFNLVDAYGKWIWNEGRPADIPACDGARVIVIDPQPYPRGWNTGRSYPRMSPTLTVDSALSAEEAASWLAKVKPDSDMPHRADQ